MPLAFLFAALLTGAAPPSPALPPPTPPPAVLADSTGEAGTSAEAMAAAHGRLRDALGRYEAIAEGGGWPSIPDGPLVEPGDTARAQVEALRSRLAKTDELGPADASGPVYDDALAAALAAFQRRHGLVVDSLLGGNTRAALNVPAAQRVEQIERALAQWDDLPAFPTGPDDRYVMVNVPEFRVRAFEGGREALQMEVIVGETYDGRETPLFHDTMERVVFRPFWNVPPGIAREELVPDGPDALADEGFEIVSHYAADAEVYAMTAANLQRVADGSLRIRQKAGPDNALGLVKYLFPNRHAVYLHDTPADRLFERADRTFSHGCIRLEDPAAFGAWVLGPMGWDEGRVRQNMTEGERQVVTLEEHVPVYIVYLTVYADDEGAVYFLDDVYDEYADA